MQPVLHQQRVRERQQGIDRVARRPAVAGAEVETARLIGIGIDPVLAAAASDPLQLTAVPLFNPTASYSSYIVPSAFIIILWQTLLMGSAMLGGAAPTQRLSAGS